MIVVLSGVSGAGKTTVARALGERLGWEVVEGDDLHPAANVARMERGDALGVSRPDVRLVFLDVSPEEARRRVGERKGHFFGAELVDSQFDELERPRDALIVDAEAAPLAVAERVARALEVG